MNDKALQEAITAVRGMEQQPVRLIEVPIFREWGYFQRVTLAAQDVRRMTDDELAGAIQAQLA